jgi:hypothetical protein
MRFFLFLFISSSFYGQYFDTVSVANKIKFVNFLKDNKQANDALYLLNYFNSQTQIDSLQLLEAKLLLELRREKHADSLLVKVAEIFPDSSHLKCQYNLINNHVQLLIGNYDGLKEPGCLNHILHKDAWRIQLISASILKNKSETFDLVFNSGKSADPNLSLIEFDLYVQHTEIIRRRKKSGFVAGLLSTILPGTGKIYAGKPHEALGSFLPVLFNGVQAAEGYYYKKFDSPHLYVFGSVATVFYASNILGSVRAAKRNNDEFVTRIKTHVEFEISKLIKYY